jgi:SAM-dependent methyltransferase
MSRQEDKLWTDGPHASLGFTLPSELNQDIAITFDLLAFVRSDAVLRQEVQVYLNGSKIADWVFNASTARRSILIKSSQFLPSRIIALTFSIPTCARPSTFGIQPDNRELGVAITRVGWQPTIEDSAKFVNISQQHGRRVGAEARKTFDDKLDSGFWTRFITGPNVLDVGFKGYETGVVTIIDGAVGVDLDYPGYDGCILPFPTESQDAVYSSHCLEHIPHYVQAIQEWYRVVKIGGHIITVVPCALLYERKRRPPSLWNPQHQRFYTPQSLLREFAESLVPNSYRVRHLVENDKGYDYEIPCNQHPCGCYEIELVVEKIRLPSWTLQD